MTDQFDHDGADHDPQLAAEFAALMLGGRLSEGPPPPGSRLAQLMAIEEAVTAGELDAAAGDAQIRAVIHEAMLEADGD